MLTRQTVVRGQRCPFSPLPMSGGVYLLHFTEPYKHARHYLGWASIYNSRFVTHWLGGGCALTQAVRAAGIGWEIGRLWVNGDRYLEYALRQWHNNPELCSVCNPSLPTVVRVPGYTVADMRIPF